MGIVMAGMLVAALQFVPNGLSAVVFGLFTLWFGWRAVQAFQHSGSGQIASHHAVPHFVLSGAMFYMVLAQPGSVTAMTSMSQGMGSTLKLAPLGAILALALFGYAIWFASQLAPAGAAEAFELAGVPTPDGASEPTSFEPSQTRVTTTATATITATATESKSEAFLAPRSAICNHIVMCITMGYMLIAML